MDFFITRPILAASLALMMMLAGGIAAKTLPISQYPPIAPPEISITTSYPGASAKAVADAVTTPIEEQVNGAEGMIYMTSESSNNGNVTITVTFEVGTDPRLAQVEVQNRASWAYPMLPEEVSHEGIIVQQVSQDLLLGVNLISPKGTRDAIFLGNYLDINISDPLERLSGVAQAQNFGLRKYAMRVWLDPGKLTNLGLQASDVISAIESQNQTFGVGVLGQPPAPPNQPFTMQLEAEGRLTTVEQFEQIILRANPDGSIVRVRDVARVSLGAADYSTSFVLDGLPSSVLIVFPRATANAVDLAERVKQLMTEAAKSFPEDVDWVVPYNTAPFVEESVKEVLKTLVIAIVLVFFVVYVFLQSFRATLIPTIAIPVSLVGTLAIMQAFGFSLNTLSLLGLVLAVGLVVDDAIVVVENVERRLNSGQDANRLETTIAAMREVRGPIVATTLVLMSVFVPVSFMPGLTGQLYNQFSLTIAMSVFLSGINSLTLSPALAALLLKPRTKKPIAPLHAFNRAYDGLAGRYERSVDQLNARRLPVLLGFVALCGLAAFLLDRVPGGFVPEEDQGYFLTIVQGPHGTTLEHTEKIFAQANKALTEMPNVTTTAGIAGYNLIEQVDQPNAGVMFAPLKNWSERTGKHTTVFDLIPEAQAKLDKIIGAEFIVLNAPSVPGLASTGGLNMELQDRANLGIPALSEAANAYIAKAAALPEIGKAFTTFDPSFPTRFLDIDRTKAKALGVDIGDLFETVQAYLGSYYVNNFNKFGRVYDVYVQADTDWRATEEAIRRLRVRNDVGDMIELSALLDIKPQLGPFAISHYNLYPSVSINATPADGYSIQEAKAAMDTLADTSLPPGFGYEWTGTVYQEVETGNLAPIIFTLSLVFVFLVLAGLFESWTLPVVVILAVPTGILGAVGSLMLRGMPLDIFGQIGLVMLIGLTAKNAILIVQFAQENRASGETPIEAARAAARTRLRPILMTAFAFILGVLPLAVASGAGANSRQSMGTTVAGGMLMATILIIIVPVLYVVIETWRERGTESAAPSAPSTVPPEAPGSRPPS
ncbi:MAG: multidrug efflux RND transporter permease subunit [Myxococcota bacterium]